MNDEENFMEVKNGQRKRNIVLASVAGVILTVLVGLFVFGHYETEKECKARLQKVQAGYLGDYIMVTVQEVMEYAWKNETWDSYDTEDMHIVEYALDDKNKIQFSINDENSTCKVAYFEEEGNVPNEPIDVKQYLDTMYQEYGHAYPQRGVMVNFSTENDTLEGKLDTIEKMKVLTLSDAGWDLSDYLANNMTEIGKKINLEVFTEDDGASYTNDSGTVLITTDDEGKISILQMEEGNDKTPSLFGLAIGGTNSGLTELEQSTFMLVSETPNIDREGTVTFELWKRDTSDALCGTYSSATNLISKLIYQADAVDENMQNELILKSTVDVNACIDKVKSYLIGDAKVETRFKELFQKKGTWDGVMQEDGSVVVSYQASISESNRSYGLNATFEVSLDGTIQYTGGEGIYKDTDNDYEKNLETETQLTTFIGYVLDSVNTKIPSAGSYDWYNDSYFVSSCELTLEEGTTNTFYVEAYDSEGFYVTFYDNGKCTLEQGDGARNCIWEYDGSNITIYTDSQILYFYQRKA